MYSPNFETFNRLARQQPVIQVCRQLLGDILTPVSAFEKLSDSAHAALLESASGGEKIARWSFVWSDPFAVFKAKKGKITLERRGGETTHLQGDPLARLEEVMSPFSCAKPPELPAFTGGAVGYLAYDAVRYVEKLPDISPDPLDLPDLYFGLYDVGLIFDHMFKVIKVVCAVRTSGGSPKETYSQAIARIDGVVDKLRTPVMALSDDATLVGHKPLRFRSNFTREQYEEVVRRCKEYVLAGDVVQVVPSQRLSIKTSAEPMSIYRMLRVINPSPYMFYLKMPGVHLIGSSPEVMVKVEDGVVTVRPIAGTRHRGQTEEEDEALAAELLKDPKDRAEHVMLLDLARNDVGRVSEFGTVKVSEKMVIERYSHVMHITSNVSGVLAKGRSSFDALRACLPAGTVSGAPKIRAMEIIEELEPEKRGPYAGAVGMVDFSGDINTCITIRTIVLKDGIAYVQAGGGIVADSVPSAEYQETMNKAQALLKAIEAAEAKP